MDEPFRPFNLPDDCGLLEAISQAAGKNAMPDFPWDPYAVLLGDNNPAVKEKLHAPMDFLGTVAFPEPVVVDVNDDACTRVDISWIRT